MNKRVLIAEIGACHFGDMSCAKELITSAKKHGATLVKSQAFKTDDVAKKGSMPRSFYEMCELSEFECLELVRHGKEVGIDVFFSIFSDGFDTLASEQKWQKIAANQVVAKLPQLLDYDTTNTFISLRGLDYFPPIKYANILHATDYMTKDPKLETIAVLNEKYGRRVGLSDHTIGIQTCKEAILVYNTPFIEKHFSIERNYTYKQQVFRDTVHSANERELEELAHFFEYNESRVH